MLDARENLGWGTSRTCHAVVIMMAGTDEALTELYPLHHQSAPQCWGRQVLFLKTVAHRGQEPYQLCSVLCKVGVTDHLCGHKYPSGFCYTGRTAAGTQ